MLAKSNIGEWITPEGLLQLEGWARDGLTDEQIAHNIGISTSTLYNWKNKKLEIVESLKKGKSVVDRQVENALLKKALGYTVKDNIKSLVKNKNITADDYKQIIGETYEES